MPRRNIRPPVKGGDSHLFRQIVDTVNGSPLVASDNDKGFGNAGHGIVHDFEKECFPLPENAADVDFTGFDQCIDCPAFTQCPDNNRVAGKVVGIGNDRGFHSGHTHNVPGCTNHSRPVVRIRANSGSLSGLYNRKTSFPGNILDITILADSKSRRTDTEDSYKK